MTTSVEKVTIIIPVFNTAAYLDECLKSVLGQTVQEIEIICIDDGSTDNSGIIIEEYAKRDNRIVVLKNDENKGPSYTRNRGLKIARGEYICFLDSDDMLRREAVEELYWLAKENDLDGVYFGAEDIYEKELLKRRLGQNYWLYKKTESNVMRGEDLFVKLVNNQEAHFAICGQFLKRASLQKYNIDFYEGIIHEDVLFTLTVMLNVERAMCIGKNYYYYRHRENSISTKNKSQENIKGYFVCYYELVRLWRKMSFKQEVDVAIDKELTKIYLMIKRQYERLRTVVNIKEICDEDIKKEHLFKTLFANERIESNYTDFEGKIEQIKQFERVIIYGAGTVGKETLEILMKNGINVFSFAVSAFDDNPAQIQNVPVKLINDLVDYKDKAIVLLAVTRGYQHYILKKLEELDFDNILTVTK